MVTSQSRWTHMDRGSGGFRLLRRPGLARSPWAPRHSREEGRPARGCGRRLRRSAGCWPPGSPHCRCSRSASGKGAGRLRSETRCPTSRAAAEGRTTRVCKGESRMGRERQGRAEGRQRVRSQTPLRPCRGMLMCPPRRTAIRGLG